jgi:hypothetical protein
VAEFTPTTEQVRRKYAYASTDIAGPGPRYTLFDRWLAQHDAEVAAAENEACAQVVRALLDEVFRVRADASDRDVPFGQQIMAQGFQSLGRMVQGADSAIRARQGGANPLTQIESVAERRGAVKALRAVADASGEWFNISPARLRVVAAQFESGERDLP